MYVRGRVLEDFAAGMELHQQLDGRGGPVVPLLGYCASAAEAVLPVIRRMVECEPLSFS